MTLTGREAAVRAGLAYATFVKAAYEARRRGLVIGRKTANNRWTYTPGDVEALTAARRRPREPRPNWGRSLSTPPWGGQQQDSDLPLLLPHEAEGLGLITWQQISTRWPSAQRNTWNRWAALGWAPAPQGRLSTQGLPSLWDKHQTEKLAGLTGWLTQKGNTW
jgi:hypothetical protein